MKASEIREKIQVTHPLKKTGSYKQNKDVLLVTLGVLNGAFRLLIFFFNFYVYVGVELVNYVGIVSSGQQRDSAIHLQVSILPQTCKTQIHPHL